jgi:hypothetical protein
MIDQDPESDPDASQDSKAVKGRFGHEWNNDYVTELFAAPDGQLWECEIRPHLEISTIDWWLVHFFYHSTGSKSIPCITSLINLKNGSISGNRARFDYRCRFFRTTWCTNEYKGQVHVGWSSKALNARTMRVVAKLRRGHGAKRFPDARKLKHGGHYVKSTSAHTRDISKWTKRRNRVDTAVTSYRDGVEQQLANTAAERAVMCGGITNHDNKRRMSEFERREDRFASPVASSSKRHRQKRHRVHTARGTKHTYTMPRELVGHSRNGGDSVSKRIREYVTDHKAIPFTVPSEKKGGTDRPGVQFDAASEVRKVMTKAFDNGDLRDTVAPSGYDSKLVEHNLHGLYLIDIYITVYFHLYRHSLFDIIIT